MYRKKIGDGLLFLSEIGQDWMANRRDENFSISEKIYDILKVPGENFDFQKKFEKSVDIFIKM